MGFLVEWNASLSIQYTYFTSKRKKVIFDMIFY